MKFWIDTEYNDYKGPLISMALVDEVGNKWYEALVCSNPSRWVAQNVMPVINKAPIPRAEMQLRLGTFLSSYTTVHIVADWPDDVSHFCNLLITGPGKRIDTPPLTFEIRRDFDTAVSSVPHNALEDALANRRLDLDRAS